MLQDIVCDAIMRLVFSAHIVAYTRLIHSVGSIIVDDDARGRMRLDWVHSAGDFPFEISDDGADRIARR